MEGHCYHLGTLENFAGAKMLASSEKTRQF
jgi:hypothetical protein